VKASERLDKWWVGLFAALSLTLVASAAHAQSGYFYLDRIQVAGAPDDGITVFRPYVRRGNRLFANLGLGYSHNPLRNETVTGDPTVADAIGDPIRGQLIAYPTFGGQRSSADC
jgi:hypothetical protein